MRNTSFAEKSLDIQYANSALRSDADGALFCASWGPERTRRFRRDCVLLARRGWDGHFRSGTRFHFFEIQRGGVQLYIVASDQYPMVPPRIFVAQRSNVLREVSKRELPSLQSWTPEATLLTVAAEAAEIAGRA